MKTRLKLLVLSLALVAGIAFAQSANMGGSLVALGNYTTTQTSTDRLNPGWKRIHVIVNLATATSGTWTPKIQGKDPVSGAYYDILVGSGITTTGVSVLKIGPGLAPLSNAAAQDFLPYTWRLVMTGTATPNGRYSVGFNIEQ